MDQPDTSMRPSTSVALGCAPPTAILIFFKVYAAGWTMHHHDMNIDFLYCRNGKVSETEEAAVNVTDATMTVLLEGHNNAADLDPNYSHPGVLWHTRSAFRC